MKIYNLTPHPVVFVDGNNETVFRPVGATVRLEESAVDLGKVYGLPVVRKTYGGVSGLPDDLSAGDVVIVSSMVGPYLADIRPDLVVLSPDTGPQSVVRDETGNIKGVRRFIRW